jgi:hypothetical protein
LRFQAESVDALKDPVASGPVDVGSRSGSVQERYGYIGEVGDGKPMGGGDGGCEIVRDDGGSGVTRR